MHSGLTERERCGASYAARKEKHNLHKQLCCQTQALLGECSSVIYCWLYSISEVKRKCHSGVKCAECALTRCTRSRENMWMLQVTVDRVQMMVDRMLRPHALNRRSCRETHIHLTFCCYGTISQGRICFKDLICLTQTAEALVQCQTNF